MKILSRDGFKNFSGWLDQGISKILKITFTDNKSIKVTPNHKFLLNDNETWIEASELKIDDILYPNVIISKIDNSIEENVYDAFDVEDNNSYYTNGVISHNCSLLYIDECAFVQNWDEFSASVLPVLSSGKDTKMIFTSTPNGLNHFYRYYEGAKKIDPVTGKSFNGFDLIEVKWHEVPGRDAKWKEETLQTLNYDMMRFSQEYCVSGDTMVTIRDKKTHEIFDVSIETLNEYMALDSQDC